VRPFRKNLQPRGRRLIVTERIKAVQRVFWMLLAVGAAVALIGIPVGDDGHTMAALDELSSFSAGFDRAALERVLLSHASVQGVVGLETVARAVDGRGVPKISVAAGAQPIAPRAVVALKTLAQVHALTAPSATIAIGSPKPESLAGALGWRLSRRQGAERYELQSIALSDEPCTGADVRREQEVVRARETALRALTSANLAQKQHSQAEDVYDLRRKWKAPWKAILKANENRAKTQEALDEAQKQLSVAQQSYEGLAKQAESFGGNGDAKAEATDASNASECAVAAARLLERPSGTTLELRVPASIDRRQVAVPRITGADFPVIQAAGLFDELKNGTVAQAIEQLKKRFSWHYRYVELHGWKLGGMTVLQLAPLAFLPLFLALMRRSRGVGATYNPFDRPAVETLPSVGVGVDLLNLLVLVVLPLAGSMLCAWSLVQLEQPPVVPVLCALASLGLGGSCHLALKELLELRDAITRSHSNPPPAPSTPG
jgi:hypothetical protein